MMCDGGASLPNSKENSISKTVAMLVHGTLAEILYSNTPSDGKVVQGWIHRYPGLA